ncbi:formate dehydrogenase, gamma subunit [Thermodesulfatator indicus DSM 15286]|uniref:Formate dehydrogenase, gamma subunit n=1 Tax=Thermodesulfatator indicus (strain DSM 15286 / JCM 11887 / CIR29812) TaxID=667014 RepID=F8ABY2_THEID|nr:formate dehydrogenase subunit gamma [Thermodesulfatator indicus]AEH45674.1 formate dehydrogenase, gamma subunit [Thermodesulfatator indicus DSM 15286]
MKKSVLWTLTILGFVLMAGHTLAQTLPAQAYLIDIWKEFYNTTVGDWAKNAAWFINYVPKLKLVYLLVLLGVPGVFFLHYLIIGPKKFSHEGEQILYYDIFARVIHWLAALFFSLLVVTGLIIIFANFFGGGTFVKFSRYVHLISAFGFGITLVPMFIMWFKDMLPATYDIKWFLILGGYLSKKKFPIPAGKYNAGQKMWFWLATLGGGFMLFTGFYIYLFNVSPGTLRIYTLLHILLGIAIVALYFTHIYMSMVAIKGALWSMITGYKSADEVSILHSKYYEKLKNKLN